MKEEERQNLYKLFRDHEDVMGSSRTTLVALESLINAIKRLKCVDDAFEGLLMELGDVIKNTEPKIVPLIHLIEDFEVEMKSHFGKKFEKIRGLALKLLTEKMTRFQLNMEKVSENGTKHVNDNDFIIVHSPSMVVKNALIVAHADLHKKFQVLILKQDFIKTKQLMSDFSKAGLDHIVIPEYNLSQYLERANKLFIGAMSVTADKKVIAAVGTAGIVSLCHLNEIPVYLLINSLKFAHQILLEQHIHKKEEIIQEDDFIYRLTTHSHDKIDLTLIDHLITEVGEIPQM